MPGTNTGEILSVVLAFLQDIGLDVIATELDEGTFLPGLTIDRGKILYDEARLTYPGDLLHEAGRIAVVPPGKRSALGSKPAGDGGEEMATTAWSYAAVLHLGLDPAIVFHDGPGGYPGEADSIIENFSQGRYFGVPILAWRGMTIEPRRAEPGGAPPFPAMLHWLCVQSDPVDEHQADARPVIGEDPRHGKEIADTSPSEATMGPPQPAKPPELPLVPYTGSRVEAREEFAALSTCLLGDDGTPIDLRDAAYGLYALFNEIGGRPQDVIGAEAFTWQQETLLPAGKAIAPFAAAACLLDYARTRAFARGVHGAIEAARIRFPGERIEILYAGTGPYAPLALLQTPFRGPDEVRFTLIDMHRPALSCQARIISVLGLEDHVAETVQADAIRWVPPEEKKYHIVIAEVMQRALIVEPQVAVTLALSKYLRPGGFLVPERIELTLCLLNPGAEHNLADEGVARLSEYFRLSGDSLADAKASLPDGDPATGRERVIIGKPLTLTGSVAEAHEVTDAGHIRLPPIRLPDRLPPGHKLRVLTRITTSGDIVLGDYDSGLTFPEPVFDAPPLTPGDLYEVWYETRGLPGLRLRPADHQTP